MCPLFIELKKKCRKAILAIAIFSFFITIFMLTIPIYMLQVFDRVISAHSYETLAYLTIIAIFVLIIWGLLEKYRSTILVATGRWLEEFLAPILFTKSPDNYLEGNHLASQPLKDVETLRSFVASPSTNVLFDAPWVPIYILAMFLLHPFLGVIAIFGAIFLFSLAIINDHWTRNLMQKANEALIMSQHQVNAVMRNAESIVAMGMVDDLRQNWHDNN